ncbi:dethiobiotin synthase [Candidatus Nitrotoga sp. M5]|uniref:dethiobiotin synthase n=1 Tax=Candidatus Nitrotoga sp. M5 TaxID=2890409 RepID=UPI001EF1AC41|nr:dethiobiotin synthase [Candidatus Nitrotoga sp. M5]CAH1386769.1 ATP-dependent dethiobiotin synthetase BioD [Candidatus Nitrotoga sp. M5]
MSYFITGTDTGVGKTLISCALLHAFAAQGQRVVGMKPVAVGCDDDGHNQDARQLQAASNVLVCYGQINPYSFLDPIAPHIAARNSGVNIDFARILTSYHELASQADIVIIEGTGGFRVPLNNNQDIADLALQLNLPVILVVGMRLGCLNHALLTASAIETCGLKCAGWVANVLSTDMLAVQDNIVALQQRLTAPLIGVIPSQSQPDARLMALQIKLELLEEI